MYRGNMEAYEVCLQETGKRCLERQQKKAKLNRGYRRHCEEGKESGGWNFGRREQRDDISPLSA